MRTSIIIFLSIITFQDLLGQVTIPVPPPKIPAYNVSQAAYELRAADDFDKDHVYFFGVADYTKYPSWNEVQRNRIAKGFNMSVGLDAMIDAAFSFPYKGGLKYYFFSGEYYSSSWAREYKKNMNSGWNLITKGWPNTFTQIDAAYYETESYDDPVVYLFRGDEYVVYDLENNKVKGGPAKITKGFSGFEGKEVLAAHKLHGNVYLYAPRSPLATEVDVYVCSGKVTRCVKNSTPREVSSLLSKRWE